ncbi:1-alkyl-2-acetylglycerophosphocholine esterase [Aureococcus anophagefferens]|nr:1-alkyl-2-acetylglycerophosphocholine esterase [Aureococcus anophagefferens]
MESMDDDAFWDQVERDDGGVDGGDSDDGDAGPSVKLELAGITVAWLLKQGGTWHEGILLDEARSRGVFVMVDPKGGGVRAGERLVRAPLAATLSSAAAADDADVRRVTGGGRAEAFGLLLLLTLKKLKEAEKTPYDRVFDAAARPLLQADACFADVDATANACARKLIETRAFQLNGSASTREDAVQALVPGCDFFNYASPSPTRLVVDDGYVSIVATANLHPDHGEVFWDYASVNGSPLVLLSQYGFLPDALDGPRARHATPIARAAPKPPSAVVWDRTVADWIRPLESNEAGGRAAFRDAANAVFDGHWRAEAAPTRVGRAARDYQIAHLSRLMARLDE